MKLRILGLLAATLCLTGCMLDTSRLYDGSIPEPPQRWPDDLATCALITTVVVPLKIVITNTQFPFIPNGKNGGGCGYASPNVEFDDDQAGTPIWRGMDGMGGGVNNYGVYYEVYMAKNRYFCPVKSIGSSTPVCQFTDPTWTYHPPDIPPGPWGGEGWKSTTWSFNRPILDRTETINGLKWRHYMFWQYESLSSDPNAPAKSIDSRLESLAPQPVVSVPHPDALESVGEVYEHAVDADHSMFVFANYKRAVTQDAHWFDARRAMLRKLVDAVTIRPLTPELFHTLMIQYSTQVHANGESGSQAQLRTEAEQLFEAHPQTESAPSH